MKPYRSILSVPGHVQKMHTKTAESVADVITLDLEDSVPQEANEDARVQVLISPANCQPNRGRLANLYWKAQLIF